MNQPSGAAEMPKSPPMQRPQGPQPPNSSEYVNCPRCGSAYTKFCYYNNYSKSQPRYFCKSCKRHWTNGGTLRNVPVGGGRKGRTPKMPPPNSVTSTPAAQPMLLPSSAPITKNNPAAVTSTPSGPDSNHHHHLRNESDADFSLSSFAGSDANSCLIPTISHKSFKGLEDYCTLNLDSAEESINTTPIEWACADLSSNYWNWKDLASPDDFSTAWKYDDDADIKF